MEACIEEAYKQLTFLLADKTSHNLLVKSTLPLMEKAFYHYSYLLQPNDKTKSNLHGTILINHQYHHFD